MKNLLNKIWNWGRMLLSLIKIKMVEIIRAKTWAKLYYKLIRLVQLKIHRDRYLTTRVKFEKDILKRFGGLYRDLFEKTNLPLMIKIIKIESLKSFKLIFVKVI
jgi:hypothetical protein